MKKKCFFIVLKKGVLYCVIIFFMLLLSLCSDETIPAAKGALLLCLQNIIPSLFPFFVLSSILIKSEFAESLGKYFSFIMRPLFRTSGQSAIAFIVGIISGCPMGAKTVCQLYDSGSVSKSEAERLLPFCNNSGPLFVVGAVGAGFLGRADIGIFLYLIHIASSIMAGFLMRFFSDGKSEECICCSKNIKTKSFGAILSESVKDSVNSILFVCGFVVLFATLSAPLTSSLPEQSIFTILVKGFLEVTMGAKSASLLSDAKIRLCLVSALLGFGGISVLLQVMGIAKESGLSIRYYFWGKLFQGTASAFMCNVFYNKTEALSVFSPGNAINFETGNFGATVTSVFIICFFYLMILAVRKNFQKY